MRRRRRRNVRVPDCTAARSAIAMTVRVHVECTALSTAGDEVIPAGGSRRVAPRLQLERTSAMQGATMNTDPFETFTADELVIPHGGIPSAAQWIMMHESGGSTTAGHLCPGPRRRHAGQSLV